MSFLFPISQFLITDDPTLLRRGNLAPLLLVNLGVAVHAAIRYMATSAMPSAVEDLGAAAYLSWATSGYLVSSIPTRWCRVCSARRR